MTVTSEGFFYSFFNQNRSDYNPVIIITCILEHTPSSHVSRRRHFIGKVIIVPKLRKFDKGEYPDFLEAVVSGLLQRSMEENSYSLNSVARSRYA